MINSVVIVGRIASIYKENEKATFVTVAVTDKYKTEFIPCVAFQQNKKFLDRYFQKGKWISIQGRISVQENAGEEKRINIVINEATFTGDKKLESHFGEVNEAEKTTTETVVTTDDFKPFEGDLPWE